MYRLISLIAVLSVASAGHAQLPNRPRTPTPAPTFSDARITKTGDVLIPYAMNANLGEKPILLWKYHKRKLANLTITNALGKQLTEKEVRKALEKPKHVLVSSDGKPVHPYYLKIVKPDTLVIIDKTPR